MTRWVERASCVELASCQFHAYCRKGCPNRGYRENQLFEPVGGTGILPVTIFGRAAT
ncbi:hypothetical protein [Moorena producens]|uniref:hypothetical protein n=1 Tax=Moorena producens TaxID=1155739 RepID=UPI001E483F53|nr:hypothetical protein [Moorena producens]